MNVNHEAQPLVIGGNGHSGTRIFLEIVECAGLHCGAPGLTRRRESEDLRIIDLLNRWVEPYVYGRLDEKQLSVMKGQIRRRLRLCFLWRSRPWAFKNPRHLLILPVLHDLFPQMKFVHVIRDGRDIALGNPFAKTSRYVDAFLNAGELGLPPEEKMILFWGRSNERAMDFGLSTLGTNYRFARWEDLCANPLQQAKELIDFAGGEMAAAPTAAAKVRSPSSLGRWATFKQSTIDAITARGEHWLRRFGYL